MMTIPIGIDYTAAMHQSAGIGRYTREMVKALATAKANSFVAEYRLFVADGKQFKPDLPGPDFSWHPTGLSERWLARLWYRLRLPLPIENWTGPLALFHATDFVLPPLKRGTGAIVTIHDLSFVREPETVMPGMLAHLNRWVPRSVERAEHVIAVSETTRQDLIELYQTPPEKITTLYHGVAAEFKPVKVPEKLAAVRQKYGLGKRPFVLSLGTIQPRKNYRRLIEAFAQLDPAFSLVIGGGKGWRDEAIFAQVTRLGLEQRVHFPGFIADADLPALYSAATLFALPSLYEGFGLPLLEAMACGTPVISSNQSSLPEVVGSAGLLVNPREVTAIAEAMSKVLTDADLHQQLSQAGLKQATKFSWDKTASRLLSLYRRVTENR